MDADMTVFDFHACEAEAIKAVIEAFGITQSDAAEVYSRYNTACWKELEQGVITQEELRTKRFRLFLEHYGLDADPEEAAALFVETLSHQSFLLEGAYEALDGLKDIIPMAIVTNGIASVQHGRFDNSPVRPFFRHLVISAEYGFFKPDPRLFFKAAELMGCAPAECLVVGDSLSSDIKGALNAGMDACWFDPQGLPAPDDIKPAYIIRSLFEIKDILGR